MPYLNKKDRFKLPKMAKIDTAGKLNYMITLLCNKYLKDNGKNYQQINNILGAIECAKFEFYRRVVSKYEDEKKYLNGDVYDR